MALGDLSRINSGYIGRGMGNSGLHQRALQQAQIQDLYSLGKEVNQSQATLRALESSRDQAFKKERVDNLSAITRGMVNNGQGSGSTRGSMGGNKRFKVNVLNENTHGGVSRNLELVDSTNSSKRRFNRLNELQFYLDQLGRGAGTSGQLTNVDFLNPEQLSQFEQRQVKNFF